MIKAEWKASALFWLISLIDGRVITPLFPDSTNAILTENNDPIINSYNARSLQDREKTRERKARLSLAEPTTYNLREPNGPGSYAFGYDNVVDPAGNEQFRSEERLANGTVFGEYGYTDYKHHQLVRVSYTADLRGYRAKTEVLPLDDLRTS